MREEIFINRELALANSTGASWTLRRTRRSCWRAAEVCAIYASNLDEFFMVRVGSLYDRTLLGGDEKENKTGMTPAQQLDAIMPKVAGCKQYCDKVAAV